MSILLIEDDQPLADGLARALRHEGYAVAIAGDVGAACRALDAQAYDLVVLDLGLPDLDGSTVVAHLRARQLNTPVLVLSARDAIEERIRLLDIGADDYLLKPAAREEFLARVRAMLRRRRAPQSIVLGRLRLDLEGKRAYVDDEPLELNGREWTLLSFLAAHPNRVVSRDEIADTLYRSGTAVSDNAIEQIMSRFRKRIGESGLNLRTVRGLGYYCEIDDGKDGE